MSDYIKLEDVLNYPLRMGNELFGNNAAFLAGVECVMDYVENPLYVPAADVAPVKHGKWIEYQIPHYFKCSECKCTVPYVKAVLIDGKRKYNYCPACGAKMDEVTK